MAKYSIEDTTLTNIAKAIREKGQTTEALTPTQMPDAISAIEAGGGAVMEGHPRFSLKLNTSSMYTTPSSNYSAITEVSTGYQGLRINGATMPRIWKQAYGTNIWPVCHYTNWVNGHRYRVLMWVWCDSGTVNWLNNNVYVNENYTFIHNLKPISTTPQLIDFTFTYQKSPSSYEPTLHIYPIYDVGLEPNTVYVLPPTVIDLDAAMTDELYIY